jgi:hypothetical protein
VFFVFIDIEDVNTLKNRNDRAAVCISAHSLMIERGRYFNINKNEKHCSICKAGQVDIFFIHSFEFFKSVNTLYIKNYSVFRG